ncbi:hypothetical protein KP806_16985 [Paenibacillus sp. N4]|uniref:hypothetical protein n=1 Tax=Paenibacillus vietnamensis TaxID=2590547 RepID=UPI001CD04B15|nr:hypothetical protein [Paenibacillus vietnamensis]MCA0756754.1 hypothetical protein [Paenibacillus vietnamensis]
MTVNESPNKKEQEQAEAAWARLEQRLRGKEASPLWEKWEAELVKHSEERHTLTGGQQVISIEEQVNRQGNSVPLGRAGHERGAAAISGIPGGEAAGTAPNAAKPKAARRWLKRHTGKAMAACAAALLAVVIATPSANEVLAAWLNQFRMDDVMVVQEDDLETLWSNLQNSGETRESVNRFGTFENKSLGEWEAISVDQAVERLGFAIPDIKIADKQIVEATSTGAQVLTLKLNVDEVNAAMRKMGADKLLPASVDGKEIKLDTGNGVQVSYREDKEDGSEKSVGITYSQSPSIQVDPSVDVKEAFDAVIRFPALPEHLRNGLQQAVNLEDGKIPIPVFTNQKFEKLTVDGTDVYLESYEKSAYIGAIWMQDGNVVNAYFHGFQDRSEIETMLAELVRP